jgi:cell division protein FtsL
LEIVTATLTGIALIKKSVDFIKENINTVQDISGIAKQIDGFFLGEEQMNKGQGKGMSIAEQFGSVEKSADDFINRKLLEEKRQELKFIINMRFGANAWEEIISERANRINQAKEAQKQARIQARKQQEEVMEILKWVGYTFIGVGLMLAVLVVTVKAFAYEYKSKDYTRQQKIWQGKTQERKYTTCRLKKIVKSQITGQQACIYQGGNKTFEMMIERNCPKQYKCIYNPNGEEPDIDKVMESLRSIAK